MRGFEAPTLSCIWTALFVMSSAIKREAWLQWSPKKLFTNQYIIIIGPAGIVKKTTAVVGVGLPVLRSFQKDLTDRQFALMKDIKIVKDKVTPEAMLNSIVPENKDGADVPMVDEATGKVLRNAAGNPVIYRRTSEVALVVSELSSMLSKRSYADGMTQILLDLYDCHDDWEWATLTRGTKILKNCHTTMLAGTTIDGLRDSIPAAATGDGFLSRVVPVFISETKREYPFPFVPDGAPRQAELGKRLAYVVENTQGEFVFDDEAKEEYTRWYHWFKSFLREHPELAGILSRMDVNVLKTALLMRAQRYDAEGPWITKRDFLDAVCLIDKTYRSLPFLLSQTDPNALVALCGRLQIYIRKRGTVLRNRLLSAMRTSSDQVDLALSELLGQGRIAVIRNGQSMAHVNGESGEQYAWLGGEDDGTGDLGESWSLSRDSYVSALCDSKKGGNRGRRKSHGAPKVHEEKRPAKAGRGPGDKKVVGRAPTKQVQAQTRLRRVAQKAPRGKAS
jgi:hypothetical protein